MKMYNLIWINGTYRQHITESYSVAFLKFRQKVLEKQKEYKTGKFIIISKEGLKYQYDKNQPNEK